MLSKRLRKRIGKNCLIWTLITAVFVAAYSTGLYMLFKAGINNDEDGLRFWTVFSNSEFKLYHVYNERIILHIVESYMTCCNYMYFGKIEDDGSLTDIYKTDYDVFDLYSTNDLLSNAYSDVHTKDYYLTDDYDRQGKVERSSYRTKYDKPTTEIYEQHYMTCPEEVFNKLKRAQNSGIYMARSTVLGHFYDGYPSYIDFSDDETVDKISYVYGRAVSFVTDYLTNYREGFLDDDSNSLPYMLRNNDGAYICRADVDVEGGKILSGELMINGDKYNFPDDNLTDSDTIIVISLHKRPDSILENNKELLRDNFDKSYLESLKYEPYESIASYETKAGLEGLTYDYKYEDGQAVISGICKYDDGYYRYVYILPVAGFFESFAPCILEVMLKVWIPGLIVISLLTAAVCRKRY